MENSIEEDIKYIEDVIALAIALPTGEVKIQEEEIEAMQHILSDYKRVVKENEELNEKIERQQDIIKNALYIINKNEKEKVDQIWLYNFDKCATLKGDKI